MATRPSDHHHHAMAMAILPLCGIRRRRSSLKLTNYTLKIGDFGLSVRKNETDDWDECQTTVCGTPSCLAPEVLHLNRNNVQLVIQWEQEASAHEWTANVSSDRVLTCSLEDLGKLKNDVAALRLS